MAKTSVIEREKKRERLVAKYSEQRQEIKDKLKKLYNKLMNSQDDHEQIINEIEILQTVLDKLPRNGSQKRLRNRCLLTGRPRGVYSKFKLCRNMIRKFAMMGLIPGLRKSSW
jgi:small subunit ribosomal protein S14